MDIIEPKKTSPLERLVHSASLLFPVIRAMSKSRGHGELIVILQIAADGNAVGDAGNVNVHIGQGAGNVAGGHVAVFRGIGGEDQLFNWLVLQPLQKLFDSKLLGHNAPLRHDDAVQHVVQAVILARGLHDLHVLGPLHHADHRAVPVLAFTNAAGIGIGVIVADAALSDFLASFLNGHGQLLRLFLRRIQQKVAEAPGGLRADPRQPTQAIDQLFQGLVHD